jgi:hypothetical protein
MSRYGTRKSPSGPKISIQLPYFDVSPVTAATVFATIGAAGSTPTEAGTEYRIPVPGKLDTLLVQNNPVGADPVLSVYQARKNGANVGTPIVIANNIVGPFRVDLSGIDVAEGDLISLSITTPAFAGAAPIGRIFFSWVPNGSV